MIRRGFWLTAGAVTGIYGYRRVAAVGRRLSASLTPGGTLKLADPGARGQEARPPGGGRPGQGDLPLHPRRPRGHGAVYGSASGARRLYPLNRPLN